VTEPATSIAGTIAAGAGAVLIASLGLEPAPLFWSPVGASLRLSFAAATSRARATVVFVAVVLVCSLFGAWLAQRFFAGERLSRNAFACALAVMFHPALNAAVTRIPALLDGLMRKLGIGGPP